ncbi:hypothetical protein [Xanthomonas phage SB4]|uniref:Uncharacterized protein n=1 Tax=Xanthomonas phage SB4 TaxID=3117473 RepID=A0ABZ2GY64_9CAUD
MYSAHKPHISRRFGVWFADAWHPRKKLRTDEKFPHSQAIRFCMRLNEKEK